MTLDVGAYDCVAPAQVRVLATPDDDLAGGRSVLVVNGTVTFDLPSPSAAWVTLRGCS